MRTLKRTLDSGMVCAWLFVGLILIACLWCVREPGIKSNGQKNAEQIEATNARLTMLEEYAADVATENARLRLRVEQLERVAGGLLPDPADWDRIVLGGRE